MRSPKIFHKRIYRKLKLRNTYSSLKQNVAPFFDFGTHHSFFSGKAAINPRSTPSSRDAPDVVSSYVKSLDGKGSGLPAQARRFFEHKFGVDFSNVRVHCDTESAEVASSIHARAFTYKNHIVFNKGEYDTNSDQGKNLFSHELTHIIQQDSHIRRIEIEHHEDEELQKSKDLS